MKWNKETKNKVKKTKQTKMDETKQKDDLRYVIRNKKITIIKKKMAFANLKCTSLSVLRSYSYLHFLS